MNVFVTGGTGFIGSRVVKRLVEEGHTVRCLVRPASATGSLERLGVRMIHGDLGDRASLLDGMTGSDCVINAAAIYTFWSADRGAFRRANVDGTRNVMECVLETGVAKVVHVSSIVVYGRPSQSPVDEDTPPGPVLYGDYARTKREADRIAWGLRESRNLPLVVIYPGAVLGPGDPKATGQYVRNLLERRLPATVLDTTSFPFVHVEDVATAIVRAAARPDNLGAKYIVVGDNLTFGRVNALVREISGVPLPVLHLPDAVTTAMAALLTALSSFTRKPPPWGLSLDQVRTMKNAPWVDGSRARRELQIEYTPIRQALEETITSFRA